MTFSCKSCIVRFVKTGYGFAGNTANVSYLYGDSKTAGQKTGLIYGVKQNGTQTLSYTYDQLARIQSSKIHTSTPFVTEYTYLEGEGANSTTTLVKTMKVGSDTYGYTYDALGNITQITKNGTVVESYEYDSLSQLTKVTNSTGVYVYTYDGGGNITSVTKDGAAIKSYTYGDASWEDLLTAFNGDTITYDNIGNPLTYRDGMSFTWQNGRQLASVGNNISYTYNADGNRISKTVNNVETEYYWLDGVLLGEKTGTNTILYLYDDSGVKYGFDLNGTRYYYILNLQGDVIGILNSAGVQVVSYTYDAWGNLLSTTGTLANTVGQLNPIRYRGYYYDAETEFYFLNTRYYDPETGRFINADARLNTSLGVLGTNLFAYCLNNPINKVDYNGNKPGDLFDTVDEAARDAAIYLGKLSFDSGWEYSTSIYSVDLIKRTKHVVVTTYHFFFFKWSKTEITITETYITKYTYKTIRTNQDPMSVTVPNAPPSKKRVATVHTHPMGSGEGITKFSQVDKYNAEKRGVPSYVYGPNGQLRRYDPATNEDIPIFNDLPISPKTPWLD